MKTRITLKSLNDLSSDQVTDPSTPAIPESSPQSDDPTGKDFREMMHHRYTTPFPYQRGGLNE